LGSFPLEICLKGFGEIFDSSVRPCTRGKQSGVAGTLKTEKRLAPSKDLLTKAFGLTSRGGIGDKNSVSQRPRELIADSGDILPGSF
jgi:hypothetical protein